MWLLKLCLLAVIAHISLAKKVLLLPFQGASHPAQMAAIADGLIDRGHDVYMLMQEQSQVLKRLQTSKVNWLFHPILQDFKPKRVNFTEVALNGTQWSPIQIFRELTSNVAWCHAILGYEVLFQKLKGMQFDFAVLDGIPFTQCMYVLAYKLDLPYATFRIGMNPCQMGSPPLPSFIPLAMGNARTTKMNFWERLQNTWELIDWCYNSRVPAMSDELVQKYAPEKPPLPMDELARRTKLWLIDSDTVVDYPRPIMPNEVFVGGLLVKKDSKSLPDNVRKIVEDAKDGVIIMSFGTTALDAKQDVFLEAFSQLKQVVLWRFLGEVYYKVPSNVHLFDWIPQADLLAHPNVKLFITHSGANGQFESIYNGIPMLQFPIFADQMYNALRSQYHGFGLTSSLATVTTSELVEQINDIIYSPTYKEKVSKASKILKSRSKTPVQRAVYWIEHVMTYGADHLMAYSLQMPWYQLLMLDILAFVLGCLLILITVMIFAFKIFARICNGVNKVKIS